MGNILNTARFPENVYNFYYFEVHIIGYFFSLVLILRQSTVSRIYNVVQIKIKVVQNNKP